MLTSGEIPGNAKQMLPRRSVVIVNINIIMIYFLIVTLDFADVLVAPAGGHLF